MDQRYSRLALLAAMALALNASAAQASNHVAALNGGNEVPPVNTPGTGTFSASLNEVTLVMTFQIDYENLLGTTTAAHIHRGTAGVNGPVVYPLATSPFPSGFQGQITLNPADLTDLMNGGLYVNVHTVQFPAGEIRGQITLLRTTVESGTWGAIKDLYR